MQQLALAGAPLNIMIGFEWLLPVAIVEHSEDKLHVWPPCFGMAANGTLAVGERATRSELRCVLSTSACSIRSGQAFPDALPDARGQGHRGISTSHHLGESPVCAWGGGKHTPTDPNDVCLRCRQRGHYLSGGVGTIKLVWPQLTDDHQVGLRSTKP